MNTIKHGQSRATGNTRAYRAWVSMKTRCSNKKQKRADNYVNKGIRVCQRWADSFEDFFMDMGPCPDDRTLDRIDNNLGYSKENCRWATRAEQDSNKSSSRKISYMGETLTATQWAHKLGLNNQVVFVRLHKGWSEVDALRIPLGVSRNKFYKSIVLK